MYIGEIGKRIDLVLTLSGEYEFQSNCWYNPTVTVYKFTDADGNVLVWKTSSYLKLESIVSGNEIQTDFARKGDKVSIKATVKAHSEYKGAEQTELTRVKVVAIDHAMTQREINERLAEEQRTSLAEGDVIVRMPYSQFKAHYADCETVAGSYWDGVINRVRVSRPEIEVIIRAGRMVPSGVRGKHFSGYEFVVDGGRCCFRAVSEENAERRCRKMFPDAKNIECVKIYR